MRKDDDDRAGDDDDLPTFEDLVDRIQEDSLDVDDDSMGDYPIRESFEDQEASPNDVVGLADSIDESKWEWIGEADEPTDTTALDDAVDVLTDEKLDAMLDLVAGTSNILLIGPQDSSVDNEICASLVDKPDKPRRRLLVTTEQSPDERVRLQQAYGAGEFDQTSVIAVGQEGEVEAGGRRWDNIGGVDVELSTISNQRDLSKIGLAISRFLGSESAGTSVICIHGLETLAASVDIEKLFRFLHVLKGRCGQTDAMAHYHLDPSQIDQTNIKLIAELFDIAIRFDMDGNLSFAE